jgi:hypothetical protein
MWFDGRIRMSANNGDRLEIWFGEYIEYTKHDTCETVSFPWEDMDLAKHGEIASWYIWKESWMPFEAMALSFRYYDRARKDSGIASCSYLSNAV